MIGYSFYKKKIITQNYSYKKNIYFTSFRSNDYFSTKKKNLKFLLIY